MKINKLFAAISFITVFLIAPAAAEEFYCEVLDVEGTVTMTRASDDAKALQEGDLLQVDDAVNVGADSYVDISYDKDWSNVTRVEESSKIVIRSIHPTTIDLEEGGVYAKLKSLPKDSTFEVKTPTAIASVRGTEYRTTVIGGETEIYNLSESNVYVYSFDEAGSRQESPVILTNSQKTQIIQRGHSPSAPRAMDQKDFQPVERFRQGIEHKIQDNAARGKVGKIQDIKTVERFHEQQRAEGKNPMGDKGAGANVLKSDENGRSGSGKRESLKPISGEEASHRVKNMTDDTGRNSGDDKMSERQNNGPDEGRGFDSGKSVFAGEKREQVGKPAGGENFEGRGLGQPYFPSDEHARSGGPEPAGFPADRWKSGFEEGKQANTSDQNFEANNDRREKVNEPMNQNHQGPQKQNQMGARNQQGPQNQQPNGNQRPGGGQAKGGAKPAKRR